MLCIQLLEAGCDTKKELEPAPTENDFMRIRPDIAWGAIAWVTSARLDSFARESIRSVWSVDMPSPRRQYFSTRKKQRVSGGNYEVI